MKAIEKRRQIRKHLIVLSLVSLVFIFLFVSGWVMSHHFTGINYVKSINDRYALYFFIWRLACYSTLILFWKPVIVSIFASYAGKDKGAKVSALLVYRERIIAYMILWELIVSQQAMKYLFRWFI